MLPLLRWEYKSCNKQLSRNNRYRRNLFLIIGISQIPFTKKKLIWNKIIWVITFLIGTPQILYHSIKGSISGKGSVPTTVCFYQATHHLSLCWERAGALAPGCCCLHRVLAALLACECLKWLVRVLLYFASLELTPTGRMVHIALGVAVPTSHTPPALSSPGFTPQSTSLWTCIISEDAQTTLWKQDLDRLWNNCR